MDEAIEFPMPGLDERKQLIKLYLDKYILNPVDDSAATAGAVTRLIRGRKLRADPIKVSAMCRLA